MGKPRYSWLLFDADHTILDFDAAEIHALEAACVKMGLSYQTQWLEIYKRVNHQLWPLLEQGKITSAELRVERFVRFVGEIGAVVDAHELSETYLGFLASGEYLIDGARQMLQSLSDDFSLACITNGIADVQHKRLAVNGLTPFFENVIVSEEAGKAKPHREFFEYTKRIIGEDDVDSMLVIGDSLSSDIRGANNAGIQSCWFNPSGFELPADAGTTNARAGKPDFIISDLSELQQIIYQ